LEEKLHVACNQRFLVVIKLPPKGAHKLRLKILTFTCWNSGKFRKGEKNEEDNFIRISFSIGLGYHESGHRAHLGPESGYAYRTIFAFRQRG
jgi:hypothetical protein